ncbi:hypothetical protein [Leptospira barantonii]|uniref:DUF5683 domain-containing protein n=1 Tax=Leptospira barantonii TaxID=2023184 RepID=A0ABX4NFS9_9LEPT|nr:hypothetical protein [Leptospira barantonii]PJZ55665.1 hypothetical protein CH367_19520 [Leptospira barantonii]
MFAKIIDSFVKKNVKNFFLTFSVLLALVFSPKVRADVLILKNGKRIKADQVKMKNGNSVEIRIGNETQTIDFSKVESILPEFSAKKKIKEVVRKEKISKEADTTPVLAPAKSEQTIPLSPTEPEPAKTEPQEINTTSVAEPKKKNRYYRLQALIPGWSPLLLSDNYRIKATGGLIAFSELYLLYKGFEFFEKPERFFQAPFGPPASEAIVPWIASFSSSFNSSTNNFPVLFFQFQAPQLVVTNRGHIMEESEFNRQKQFYMVAFAAVLTLDFVLSSKDLIEGDFRSVRLSTSDGGRTSNISLTWVF